LPKDPSVRPTLRLIDCEGSVAGAGVVRLDEAAERAREIQCLKAEARDFEARNGKNLYSDFILKHGRRPDPDHAATLGELINIQVKASDGSLQPKLTRADRAARKKRRDEQELQRRPSRDARQVWCSLRDLGEIQTSPADLACILLDRPDSKGIRERLQHALEYLERVAEGMRHELERHRPPA
jgi:hypothetical protein